MYNREEYVNGKCSHETYYGQFVTPYYKDLVLGVFEKKYLQQEYKKDTSFNTVPLYRWDTLANLVRDRDLNNLMITAGDFSSLAGKVCLLKECARQIVNEEK